MELIKLIEVMVKVLGSEGAVAGLRASRVITKEKLQEVAIQLQLEHKRTNTKIQLIEVIILHFNRKIDKPFEELTLMDTFDLEAYFINNNVSKYEIMDFLTKCDIPFKKSESRIALIHHAAVQISTLGMYQRIARNEINKGY